MSIQDVRPWNRSPGENYKGGNCLAEKDVNSMYGSLDVKRGRKEEEEKRNNSPITKNARTFPTKCARCLSLMEDRRTINMWCPWESIHH